MAPYSNKIDYEIIGKDYPVMVFDNFYSDDQVKDIWYELDGYNKTKSRELWTSNLKDTNRAKDSKGNSLSTNERIYLDQLYQNRNTSMILFHYKKIMSKAARERYFNLSAATRNIDNVNRDYSMISYYTGGDKYDFHKDNATHTALWWTYKEPKAFTGGDLVLKDGDFTVDCKHNRLVMFPSFYLHASTPIKMEYANDEERLGKYTISHFFNINT